MDTPSEDDLVQRYRARLLDEAAKLRAASDQSQADRRPVELDQQSVGRLSRMDAMQQQAMASAQDSRRQARLVAINAALRRLEEGDFGFCTDCGDFIGLSRLDLDPVLMRCVPCAS